MHPDVIELLGCRLPLHDSYPLCVGSGQPAALRAAGKQGKTAAIAVDN
jgi:hypothetical protein